MSKYINADDIRKLIDRQKIPNLTGVLTYNDGLQRAITEIATMPAADVVEVVRCKDCKYSVCIPRNIGEDWFCDIKYNEWGEPWGTLPEGFCDVGERKETE